MSSLDWLAGYIQGDGSAYMEKYSANRDTRFQTLTATTKDYELAIAVQEFGFKSYKWTRKTDGRSYWKSRLRHRRATDMLNDLEPLNEGKRVWIEWAAGFFDAEGCILFNSAAHCWRLVVTNMNVDLLIPYAERYGGGIYLNGPHNAWDYIAQARVARTLAAKILPFVRCNRKADKLKICAESGIHE